MRHEAAGSVRISRALHAAATGSLYAAGQLQLAAPRDTSESTALCTAAREVALYLGHDQDVGGVAVLNGVAHRYLLFVRCWCHGVDLGLHLADQGGVKPRAVVNLHRVLGLGLVSWYRCA